MRNLEPPAKSKMAARGPQDGQRGLEGGLTLGYWPLWTTLKNVVASRPPNGDRLQCQPLVPKVITSQLFLILGAEVGLVVLQSVRPCRRWVFAPDNARLVIVLLLDSSVATLFFTCLTVGVSLNHLILLILIHDCVIWFIVLILVSRRFISNPYQESVMNCLDKS